MTIPADAARSEARRIAKITHSFSRMRADEPVILELPRARRHRRGLCPVCVVVCRASSLPGGRRDPTHERSGMRIGQIAIDVAPLREGKDFRLLFAGRSISM